jgi:hypothetical protein
MQPPVRWREVFFATAPYWLILSLDGIPKLLTQFGRLPADSAIMKITLAALIILTAGCLISALVLAIRNRWPLWSASWIMFYGILVFLPLGWLMSLALPRDAQIRFQDQFLYLILPLAVAISMYWVTREDRLRGLLAALPILYALWLPNLEQTPRHIIPVANELWVKTISTGLLTMAIVGTLRMRDWRKALWLVLGAFAGIGLSFSYVGIYHGGTLPFIAPGPSLVEVVKSFVPQYLAVCAVLLGPQFARMFREIGRRGGKAGNFGYHLALLSLLVVIIANLLGIMIGTGAANKVAETRLNWLILIALAGYLVGFFILYQIAIKHGKRLDLSEITLLPTLPLGIPFMFALPFGSWKWPISELYAIPIIWELPGTIILTIGLAWLCLSVWLITRRKDQSSAFLPLPQVG